MNISHRFFSLTILGLLYLLGCESQKIDPLQADILDDDVFINLIAEFELLNSFYNESLDSASVLVIQNRILDQYNVTLNQYSKTEKWHQRDPRNYSKMLSKALDMLNKEENLILGIPKATQTE